MINREVAERDLGRWFVLQQTDPHASLQAEGYEVVSVQYGLDTNEADVAATLRTLGRVSSPAILVGHSYGGSVITAAGTDDRVAGLVYIAALAPVETETSQGEQDKFSVTDGEPEGCRGRRGPDQFRIMESCTFDEFWIWLQALLTGVPARVPSGLAAWKATARAPYTKVTSSARSAPAPADHSIFEM